MYAFTYKSIHMGNNNIVHELGVTTEEKNVPDKYLHCFNSTFINSSTGWRPAGGSLSGRPGLRF